MHSSKEVYMENKKTIFSFSEFICICKQLPIQFYLYGIKLQQQPPPRKDPAIIKRKPQQSNDPFISIKYYCNLCIEKAHLGKGQCN